MSRLVLALVACLLTSFAHAAEIRIGSFNTESEGAKPAKVAETIRKVDGVDIWAFQEVESEEALKLYRDAARESPSEHWRYVISESGPYADPDRKPDHVAIAYRTDLFRQLETVEYHAIRSKPDAGSKYGKPDWGMRAALFLRLAHITSGTEFYVGTVHLKCCDAPGPEQRAHQTALLAAWIKRADAPVILLGDTNIPIEPGDTANQVPDAAFKNLINDGDMTWIAPQNPVKTNCNPNFNSMLDQVYRTTSPKITGGRVRIQFPEPAYCDQPAKDFSDHRPIVGIFNFP